MNTLTPNHDWAKLPLFDRTGWRTLPFGEFAQSINERVEPSEAAEDIYVGLEHLDPQSLHIQRWGKGSDVIGTKLRFRKGDIIFGRRRAYQRKLAVAEFDGICSAHAMVVRAKPDVVLPEFLPFLMMSDRFMNRAVEISVGSLSPTINWKILKLEEFALPPLDQQRRIAEVLCAVDEVATLYGALQNDFAAWHEARRDAVVTGKEGKTFIGTGIGPIPAGWKPNQIRDSVTFTGGAQPPRDTFEYKASSDNIRLIQIRDYKSDEFLVYIRKDAARRSCAADDVMIGRYGPPIFQILRGLVGSYNVALIKADPKPELSKGYLYHFLKQRPLFDLIDHLSQRSAGQTGIDMDALKNYPLPLPPLDDQLLFAKSFDEAEEFNARFERHIRFLREIISRVVE